MKWMKTGFLVMALATTLVSCKKEEYNDSTAGTQTTEVAGTTAAGDLSPMVAQMRIDDVTIGHELGADGMIPAGMTGDDFAPGQPIHIAMSVADAPAGASVKVVWYAPGETKINEETKSVDAGMKNLTFSATDTASWAKGDYRAEIWTGDEKVNTQQFQIVDAAGAGK